MKTYLDRPSSKITVLNIPRMRHLPQTELARMRMHGTIRDAVVVVVRNRHAAVGRKANPVVLFQ